MDEQLQDYLTKTLDSKKKWVLELERYAKEKNVPIMDPLGIDLLMQLIRMKKPKKILEIGTAIGYSALLMHDAYPKSSIVTIERDEIRYKEALKNINGLEKQKFIDVLYGDALELSDKVKEKGPFDVLFIDAAKGQYQKFFELYSECLNEDAIIVSDNVLFKGYVFENTDNKRLQKVAAKINRYNEWLVDHPSYKTTIVPIGDGVAITVKRQNA